MHAAWLDGEIVCAGISAPTPRGLLLYGGATLERARGRGAYRSLVRARWDDAVVVSAHGREVTPAIEAVLKDMLERAVPVTFQDVVVTFCTVVGARNGQLVQITDGRKVKIRPAPPAQLS